MLPIYQVYYDIVTGFSVFVYFVLVYESMI